MKKKLISILITNYNKQKFIDRCLKSASNQTYRNFEIILFDDCSSDNSINIIRKYKNVKLVRNKIRSNKSSALNQINGIIKAFKRSSGNIICLLDSDDFFKKDKLRIISKKFKENKFNSVYNYPKASLDQFNYKEKKDLNRVWPTILPTSCLSFTKNSFQIFLKNINRKKFLNLEIDARLIIFFKFFFNEYNVIQNRLTIYNSNPGSITAGIKKFSVKWWLRRYEAFQYLKIILRKKHIKFNISLDYLVTLFIYLAIKSFL